MRTKFGIGVHTSLHFTVATAVHFKHNWAVPGNNDLDCVENWEMRIIFGIGVHTSLHFTVATAVHFKHNWAVPGNNDLSCVGILCCF